MSDILADKSESEIRRAAAWWFTAQGAYCRGESVPLTIFLLSARDLTADDVAFARVFVAASGFKAVLGDTKAEGV